MSTFRYFILSLTILLLQSSSILALSIPINDLNELTKQSRLILIGVVSKVECDLGGDKRSIFTFVTLKDLTILRGEYSEKEIRLRFEGGQVGFRVISVPGIPSFHESQKVLLFLRTTNPSICPLVGCSQGYFKILQNSVTDIYGNEIVGFKEDEILKKYLATKYSTNATGGFKSTSSTVRVLEPVQDETQKLRPIPLEQFISEIRKISSKLGPELPPEIEMEAPLKYGVDRFRTAPLKESKKRE
jgi:hypothetical protein